MPVIYVKNGGLYVNGRMIGDRVSSYKAACSGDVAWMNSCSVLYMNKTEVSSRCQSFELRADGKVLWLDSHGDYHYR